MSVTPPKSVNSVGPVSDKDGPSKPFLQLVGAESSPLKRPSRTPGNPLPEEASALARHSFSSPPWLLARNTGYVDEEIIISGDTTYVIPVDALEQMAGRWLADLRDRLGRSGRTLESYEDVVQKLLWFLRERRAQTCGETELYQFLEYLRIGHTFQGGRWGNPKMTKELSDRSRHIYYVNLRALLNWGLDKKWIRASPLQHIDAPPDNKKLIKPFTQGHLIALMEAAKKTGTPRRDVAVLSFLLETGLRAEEFCALRLGDMNWQERTAYVAHGKGNKERYVVFSPDTHTIVWQYLEHESRPPNGFVFTSTRNKGFTRSGLQQLFERLGDAAGITDVRCSPHTMRHTTATFMLMLGATLEEVRQQLGHSSLRVTTDYIDVTTEFKRQRFDTCSPVSNLLVDSNAVKRRGRPSRFAPARG